MMMTGPNISQPRLLYYSLLLTYIDGERSDVNKAATIAGGFLGTLIAIMLVLLIAVGIVIFMKKGIQNCFRLTPSLKSNPLKLY